MLTCLYFFCAFVSGGYIVFSFVVGELVDFGGDITHAFEGIAHDFSGSLGHALDGIFHSGDAAHADLSHDVHDSGHTSPSPFSLRTIAMFMFGFGGGGLVGKGFSLPDILSLIPAFGTGLVLGFVMWNFMKWLYNAEGTTSIQDPDFVGLIARVSVSIPADGRGAVAINVKGQRMNFPAISDDKTAIPQNTEISVVSKEGGVVIVRKI